MPGAGRAVGARVGPRGAPWSCWSGAPIPDPRSRLGGDFRELTTRRSAWEGEGFVLQPGRGLSSSPGGWGVGWRVCEKL